MSKLNSIVVPDWHPAWETRTPVQRPTIAAESTVPGSWTPAERVGFRFAFLYFVLQAVPLDWRFYRDLLIEGWNAKRELAALKRLLRDRRGLFTWDPDEDVARERAARCAVQATLSEPVEWNDLPRTLPPSRPASPR